VAFEAGKEVLMGPGFRFGMASALVMATACGARVMNETVVEEGDGGAKLEPAHWNLPPSNTIIDDPPCGGAAAPAGLEGTWEGTVNDPLMGARAVRLELHGATANVDHFVCGTATFGSGAPPPLPTDPRLPPPGVGTAEGLGVTAERAPVDGFPYTIRLYSGDGWGVTGGRVHFAMITAQPYKAWCEIQTSFPPATPFADGGHYACLKEAGRFQLEPSDGSATCTIWPGRVGREPDPPVQVGCAQVSLCYSGVCQCGDWGCSVSEGGGAAADLQLKDGVLAGAVTWEDTVSEARLTHTPH
jgi:hypothetical protein